MRTYDEIWEASSDEPPFSNGSEGEAWTANWCDRCLVDAPFRNGIAPTGCPLLTVAMMGRTPSEWFEHEKFRLGGQYHCVEFRAPGGGGGEPKPRPKPRDQFELFGREGNEGRRTLAPLPERAVRELQTTGGVL